jgi:predicted nucleic acid-binding protein
MTAKQPIFIDTNLWIYGLVASQQPDESHKHQIMLSLLQQVLQTSTIHISSQVLNECHWNLIKKFGCNDQDVQQLIATNIIPISIIDSLTLRIYHQSFIYRTKYHFSFWDSLIVASAIEAGCRILYTEDMQHQQHLEDKDLMLLNPFL